MIMLPLTLRGKTFPVNFTHGWIQTHLNVLGADGVPGLIGFGFREWFSKIGDVPLYQYYRYWWDKTIKSDDKCEYNFEPIDYWFLEQMRKSLDTYYGPAASIRIAPRLGANWWGNSVFHTSWQVLYNLPYLLGFDATWLEVDQDTNSQSPAYKPTPLIRMQRLIRLASHRFIDKMQNNGGIAGTLVEHDTGLLITFPDCPFCANQLPECNILFGVVQGMLRWISDTQSSVTPSDEENMFILAREGTKMVEFQLVDNDSHLIRINFVN
jgi:hypothetical protein